MEAFWAVLEASRIVFGLWGHCGALVVLVLHVCVTVASEKEKEQDRPAEGARSWRHDTPRPFRTDTTHSEEEDDRHGLQHHLDAEALEL